MSYKVATVEFWTVHSTDSDVIEQLYNDLHAIIPSVVMRNETIDFQSGKIISCSFDKLKKHTGRQLQLWMLRWFCEHDWEPFSVTGEVGSVGPYGGGGSSGFTYHFRKLSPN